MGFLTAKYISAERQKTKIIAASTCDVLNSNPKINVETADFIAINDDIYYMVISSIASEKSEIKRHEFMFVKDNNLYSFEFVYPYADAELDDFYLNIIRSMEIKKPKYLVSGEGYKINDE